MDKELSCSICGEEIKPTQYDNGGFGFNPQPVTRGISDRCCMKCDNSVVIPARLKKISEGIK